MFIVMKEIEKLLKSFREVLKILGSCSPLGLAITIVVAGLEFTAINSQVLQMEHNRLSGELPRCWTQWTKHLKMIILHSNNIGGNIPPQIVEDSEDDFTKWFHIGKAFGFAYGFWGVCFSLFFFRTWRLAYFRFLNKMNDRIYVFVVLKTKWFH
ncbi:uncharacterized protein LOC129290569 isoform X2 [Prosopis cineraria]|uniref:uncharacterized protein LOC129290569 isoform X2 n=1 Tax=Prosopis cineraria TaxID=364024 RepID=UPI0024103787|nr:uncharacterized protein LOC129290569 isoform X2 [Prosopis cineraria]